MDKQIEFPCTNKCLVYASCQKLCMPYRDYVEEAYRERKYKCFKIVPPPPLQIQQLSELMNRIEDGLFSVKYFPTDDILMISLANDELITIMGRVRKRKNLHDNPKFPEELK